MAAHANSDLRIRSGTSGWTFSFWDAHTDFYTDATGKRVRGVRQLDHYAQHLSMVELNATFYRVPPEKTWVKWRERARTFKGDFIFCVKMNRYATHNKLLKDPDQWWPSFWERAKLLEERLGPILFQFPPRFAATPTNVLRLEALESVLPKDQAFVFEFRNKTWKREDIAELFERTQWSTAIVHVCNKPAPWSRRNKAWTQLDEGWTNLCLNGKVHYIRVHGTEAQYSGTYQGREAADYLLDRILEGAQAMKPTYAAFNNTDTYELMSSGKTLPSAIADACGIEQIFRC